MPRKKVIAGQHTVTQVKQESIFKFNEVLKAIDEGRTKTSALKEAHMDKKTFQLIQESRHTTIQQIDKKGHYSVRAQTSSYAKWEVYWQAGPITIEELDYANSSIMGHYWNAVKNSIAVGNSGPLSKVPDFVQNVHGIYIPLQKDFKTLYGWNKNLRGYDRFEFERDLYNLESAIA